MAKKPKLWNTSTIKGILSQDTLCTRLTSFSVQELELRHKNIQIEEKIQQREIPALELKS